MLPFRKTPPAFERRSLLESSGERYLFFGKGRTRKPRPTPRPGGRRGGAAEFLVSSCSPDTARLGRSRLRNLGSRPPARSTVARAAPIDIPRRFHRFYPPQSPAP